MRMPLVDTAYSEAIALEHERKYDLARARFAKCLGELAVDAGYYHHALMTIYTHVGRLYVAEALQTDRADARKPLMAQAAGQFTLAEASFLAVQPTIFENYSPDPRNTTSPRIAWFNAGILAYRWLADIHTLAAINPGLNWDGRDDHAAASSVYAERAMAVAMEPGIDVLKRVSTCAKGVRNARLMGNEVEAVAWQVQAAQNVGSVVLVGSRGDKLQQALAEIDEFREPEVALESLRLDLGIANRSVRLLPNESPAV